MTKPEFVYVIMIARPPQQVWEALTTPGFTKQYWHETEVESDFKVGSTIRFMTASGTVGAEGEVLSVDYPTELSYTWQFPNNPDTSSEPRSRVTFRLEAVTTGTKLTVCHDRFPSGSRMFELVRGGWPLVLSGLKTLLETGTAVDFSGE